ncbi:AAA family ATPase [Streptomyces sp. NPDC005571]|uniref:AAA family ATPase n=1 Tax=Streptomyces sp. NPDC005571 TaxID=3156888 RepID=UPI0033AFF309
MPTEQGPREAILVADPKDDDGYLTLYDLWFRDGNGSVIRLGLVKIAYNDQLREQRTLTRGEFTRLDHLEGRFYWFSVGQGDSYYENIRKLGRSTREEILEALRDIAFIPSAFKAAMDWDVTHTSLLRSVERRTVEYQFRRIALGGPRLTKYRFDYTAPHPEEDGTLSRGETTQRLTFEVKPHSTPPTNIHVLIGRNGVGKTTLLGNIAKAVVGPDDENSLKTGRITWFPWGTRGAFANVVSVTFSAFDPFEPLEAAHWPHAAAVSYTYVGLTKTGEQGGPAGGRETYEELTDTTLQEVPPGGRKTYEELADEFTGSILEIIAAGRVARWIHALDRLGSDPHLAESPIQSLARSLRAKDGLDENDRQAIQEAFFGLSSGHKIVLLTITRLVETVAERSLVLLDEPEAHLHPPLLSAFIRALSDLLTDRNGVALIATHSPVVLQEVPRSCVWKLSRWESQQPGRPAIETFGENVGVLTHEIFGLEVRESGFQAEVEKAVQELGTYDAVLARFNDQLGSEAKGLVRILLAHRTAHGGR